MLHALIMAGGSGTRFWPASRAARPKQLLNLTGQRTLLQATLDRLGGLVPPERTLVMTNERLAAAVAEQLPDLPAEAIVGEPCKRDTAPCVGLAAALVARRDPAAVMLVAPADHVIETRDQFHEAVRRAERLVEERPSRIVTFGVRPTYPAEVFGYIERGDPLDDLSPAAFHVVRFREKPDAATAKQYLASGRFYWNAGIFVWRAETILNALERFEPQMCAHVRAIAEAAGGEQFPEVFRSRFEAIRGKSIDYAVMERYEDVVVLEAPFSWSDVGGGRALARLRGQDAAGNTVEGRHLGIDASACIVRTDHEHLVVTLGVKDLIVVHTPDATLVAHKDCEEAIRKVVQLLEERGWTEYL